MRNKIIVGFLGLAIVVAGIVAFAAFTAQVVNLTARVEKEIELAPVVCDTDDRTEIPNPDFDPSLPPDPATNPETIPNPDRGKILADTCVGGTGDYGVVLPQRFKDKFIELTLSKSFFKQTEVIDVVYDVLWECKQASFDLWNNDVTNADGKYTDPSPDTIPDCRDNLPHTNADLGRDAANNAVHVNEELDDNLRKYIDVLRAVSIVGFDTSFCLDRVPPVGTGSRHTPTVFDVDKEIELIGDGELTRSASKCIFQIKLLAPPCEQGYNPYTDPDPKAVPVDCHEIDTIGVGDPQDIEVFTDIGDDFKIQVYGHSTQ
jgi:hypothetical protein